MCLRTIEKALEDWTEETAAPAAREPGEMAVALQPLMMTVVGITSRHGITIDIAYGGEGLVSSARACVQAIDILEQMGHVEHRLGDGEEPKSDDGPSRIIKP
jgi:hypothetical protein